jgi:predicted XRE-type DNA-binding protein
MNFITPTGLWVNEFKKGEDMEQKVLKNADLRKYIKRRGVSQWQVADILEISLSVLVYRLNKDLTDKEINEIKAGADECQRRMMRRQN